jgi:hypothetical protein
MKPKLLLGLALVLSGIVFTSTMVFAVDPKIFTPDKIQEIWPELWKEGAQEMKVPAIDPLSEQQVVKEMAGKWFILSGSFRTDRILISVETNRQVTVSGTKDGIAWEANGQWQVISNKLVLFVKSGNNLPDFIFRIKGRPYMFDEWKETLMSEMKREKPPVATVKVSDPDRQFQLQPVQAVNGKMSMTNIFAILDSMDNGFRNKDAAAISAGFASNAVIIATVVEGPRTTTMTNDTSSYRRDVEAGFKSFDEYELQRKDVAVEITSDGQKATSQSTLVETYRFSGKAERAVTQESATFEVLAGKIRLIKLNSQVKVTIE